MTIELIGDRDCPNVPAARAQLMRALAQAGLPVRWQEWDRGAPNSPPHVRRHGSPTILADGRDILGGEPSGGGNCCRLYHGSGGRLVGVPALDDLVAALHEAHQSGRKPDRPAVVDARWREAFAMLPTIGVALLPKLTCPACWPAYASALSVLGLGFVNYTPILLPLTALFLLVSVGLLLFTTRRHRRIEPVILGIAGAAIVMGGKFAWHSDSAMFGGLMLLMGASLWNTLLVRKTRCPIAAAAAQKSG